VIHSVAPLFTLWDHYGGQTGERIVVKLQSKVIERILCKWNGASACAVGGKKVCRIVPTDSIPQLATWAVHVGMS
jgi:hypothetical protein